VYRSNFDQAKAEDLLMDIFFKAYKHFDRFNPKKGSFKTWLFAIAHNHLISSWRNKDKKETLSLETLEEKGFTPIYEDSSVADELTNQIENSNIRQALSYLGEAEREMIQLRYFEDLKFEEISKITGQKEATVRQQLSRARKNLARYYEKFYPPNLD
jgi:RNA polymerase sigma-70 factor (ECF subfamily)